MKMFRVVVNGNEYKVGIEELVGEQITLPSPAKGITSIPAPAPAKLAAQPVPANTVEMSKGDNRITAPMPGTILRVAVNAGDKASKGQTLLVLEAMKMENEILAPSDCLIKEVAVSQGVSVNVGDTLVVMSS